MIKWFSYHPTAANLLMAALMLLGFFSLPGLQRETFPEIKNDKVEIRVIYKGATAEEVEDAICRRIEDKLESIVDLDEIRCESREGLGIATAVMNEGAEMPRFLDDIKSEIDAIDDFPDAVELPVIEELGRTDKVVSIAISGPEKATHLKDYAEHIKEKLQAIDNIAQVTLSGFSQRQLLVEVSATLLRQYGLSANDLANSIAQQSISSPAGQIEGKYENVLLRLDEQRKTVAELESLIVISGSTGASIRLGDIARISDQFELDEQKILFDGKRAAILTITKTRSEDILKVNQTVRDFVAQQQLLAPQGIELVLTQDVSSVVSDRLNMLVRNGMQGLILVFLILWLFFSFRYSFWVTMGLPVSFLGALYVLPMLGVTINMISMVGLLIGIGLLMDDAIVIAENIAAQLNKGEKALAAAVKGVTQVLPGISSSFATTLLVFGSLAFISGEIGQILRVMPIVLIVVVSVSLLEAFLILPNHLGHSLEHIDNREPSKFRTWFEQSFANFRDNFFEPLLDKALKYRYLTVGIIIMLLLIAVSMPMGGKLKFVGFPTIEGDIVEARVLLPQGTPLAQTEQVVKKITAALTKINQKFSALQVDQHDFVRHATVYYGENPDAHETGPHVARVVADLLSAEVRQNVSLDDFRQMWREETGLLTDVLSLTYVEPTLGPGGKNIDIRIMGSDLSQLKSASEELKAWLKSYAGVIDISDDLRPGKREYRLRIKPSSGVLGIKANDIANQVRTAFQGMKIDEFPLGSETYEVELQFRHKDRITADALELLSITSADGALIPLPVVADIQEKRGWARINRVDGQRTISIQGDVQPEIANAQEILGLAQEDIFVTLKEKYPDIHIAIEGKSKETAKTGKSIVSNVLWGFMGIYMLLAIQFRSYLVPVTVMSVMPTALIGVIFGHMLMGLDLTLPSMIGMASLFGVVVNDSILLVVFIKEAAKNQSISVLQAAKQAGHERFRPILLTSITTIAGLLPLLLEKSLQAQILIPLATSLAFGLATATIIALFLVPSIYCILDDFKK